MKISKAINAFVPIFIFVGVAGFSGISSVVHEGNKLFGNAEYDKALAQYTQAQLKAPENPLLDYNIGAAQYKQKKYDDALKSFQKAIDTTDDEQIKAKAWYNMGNTYFKQAQSAGDMQLLEKAVKAYTEALKINPDDEDAKYNLEVARRMIDLKKEEKQNPQNNQNQEQQQQNQEQQQATGEKNIEQDESKNATAESKPATAEAAVATKEQEAASSEAQAQPQQQQQPGEMTKEEAERLLNALEDKEKQNLKEDQEAKSAGNAPFAGKDW